MQYSLKKQISFIVIIAVWLGITEVMLRIIFPISEVINFNRINYSPTIHVPGDRPAFLSNAKVIWASEPDGQEFIHTLNLYGFRDKTWTIKPLFSSQMRFMFVGDSFVEGFMAPDNETISEGFKQANINKNNSIEVLNLGIGAAQLPDYCKVMRDAVPLFNPQYLILILHENDFSFPPSFDPSWFTNPLRPDYSYVAIPHIYYIAKLMIAKQTIPRIWHSPPFRFIASVPDKRNPWSSEEGARHFETFVTPAIANSMKKGRFNPFFAESFGQNKNSLTQSVDIFPYLEAIKNFIEDHACKLFIAYIPFNHQVSDSYLAFATEFNIEKKLPSLTGEEYQLHARMLEQTCRQLNIPFKDLTPIFRKHELAGERLYWNYDEHMKGGSYLLIGRYLYEWIEGYR